MTKLDAFFDTKKSSAPISSSVFPKRPIGVLPKILPVLGVGVAYLFFGDRFGGAHFAAFVALFATPVAVSSLPMAQEMGNDAELAGQYVVWTTLVSALSIFLASLWLKQVGIF